MVRTVCAQMAGEFSPGDVLAAVSKAWGAQAEERVRMSVYTNLLNMADQGELKSTGTGRARRYTVVKLKDAAPTEQELKYQEFRNGITVPRDPVLEDSE